MDPSNRRRRRTIAAAVFAAIVALLAAACGSSSSGAAPDGHSSATRTVSVVAKGLVGPTKLKPVAATSNGAEAVAAALNPEARLQEAGAQTVASPGATYDETSLQTFMSQVAQDVAQDWSARFAQSGLTWQPTQYYFFTGSGTVDTPCGIAGDPDYYPNAQQPPNQAFACSDNLTVYMSVDWIYQHVWNSGVDPTGAPDSMGVGSAEAHEFFHIVQFQLGITNPSTENVAPIELQADCGSGVWGNDKYRSGQLAGNDVSDAAATMASLGDEAFADPTHHGTPDQRKAAYYVGYNSGDISQCTLTLDQTLPMYN